MVTLHVETVVPSFPKRSCSTMASLRTLEAEYLWKDFDESLDIPVIPRLGTLGLGTGRAEKNSVA